MRRAIFLAAVAILIFLFIIYKPEAPEPKFRAKVTEVIDGDTFHIKGGTKVRILGIDTPEKGQRYFDEAKDRLKELIENKTVLLEKDRLNKDRYGRLLRYVYVGDIFVDYSLLKEGYGKFFEANNMTLKYQNEFFQAENYAKANQLGIWSTS